MSSTLASDYIWHSRIGGGRFTEIAGMFKVSELSFVVIVEAIDPATSIPYRENSIRGTFATVEDALIEAEYWVERVMEARTPTAGFEGS